jgi:hypothetical protein
MRAACLRPADFGQSREKAANIIDSVYSWFYNLYIKNETHFINGGSAGQGFQSFYRVNETRFITVGRPDAA